MNKSREEQLEAIRGKCRLANPDKDWDVDIRTDGMWTAKYGLADILLAIEKHQRRGRLSPDLKRISEFSSVLDTLEWWNLRADNITLQDDSTIQFIFNLLQ